MWSLQAAGTQVRMLARGLRDASQQTVDVASARQTARAEMRTVVETDDERVMVRAAARREAAGRGSAVVPITESDFTNAVFAGVASGLSAQRAVDLVPTAANLGLAGQATTAQAQIGLTQLSKFYPEAEFVALADQIAKTQDMFAFPGGLTQLTEGFRGAGAAAQQWRLSLEDQLITQGVFADVGRRGAQGGTATRILLASMGQGFARLGLDVARKDDGSFDMVANLRAIQGIGLSQVDMNRVFTRRGATAITQQLAGLDKHIAGLGDVAGTAAANAAEHADTYDAAMRRLNARTQLLTAELGEGAISVRKDLANLAVGAIDAGLALGERFPRLIRRAGGALEVGGMVATGAGGVLETAVGVNALAQLMGQGRLGRAVRGLFAPLRGLWGLLRRGGPLLATAAGGIAKLVPAFGSFVMFAGRAIGLLSMAFGRAVAAMAAGAAAKFAAVLSGGAGTAAAGAGAATAAVGAGVVAAAVVAGTAAAVGVGAEIEKGIAGRRARREAAAAGATPEETAAMVSAAREEHKIGVKYQAARAEGKGPLVAMVHAAAPAGQARAAAEARYEAAREEGRGWLGATAARLFGRGDPGAPVTAAAGEPATEGATVATQPAALITVAAGQPATAGAAVAAQPAALVTVPVGAAVAEGATIGTQPKPLVTTAAGQPATEGATVAVQPAADENLQGAAGRRARRARRAAGTDEATVTTEPAALVTAAAAPPAAEGATAAAQPAALVTAAAGPPAVDGATVAAQPAALVTAAVGEAITEGATIDAQPAALVTTAVGQPAAEGTTVAATPAALITTAAGDAATEGATVAAQPAALVTTAAGGAPAEGATVAADMPPVTTAESPTFGPQLAAPQVPALGPQQQDGGGGDKQVPLLQAVVMELRKLNHAAQGQQQGVKGRRARRQQREPAPHVLDFDATLGALDSV